MLPRLLIMCSAVAIYTGAAELPVQATGMLEYASKTALVVRLSDDREIQIAIPGSMPNLASGRELGDWVDVSYGRAGRILDQGLNLNLYVELTDIRDFRKPSPSELEQAEASPIRKFRGNLLHEPDAQLPAAESGARPAADLFAAVRERVESYFAELPHLIAEEATERLTRTEDSSQWTILDQIATQVQFDGRHEVRTNILFNGSPWGAPYEALPGMKWRAAYLRMVHAVSTSPKVQFESQADETLNGHAVIVYSYRTPLDSISHWYMGEQGFWPAVNGKIWVSKQDDRVLQLEQSSAEFPPDFPLTSVTERICSDYVQVGSRLETLPVTSEVTWVWKDNGRTLQNRNTYNKYRRTDSGGEQLAPSLVDPAASSF
jgi:hypothetical protein